MSETYTVVLPGNIEPHFNTRLERDAFIEWKDALQATIAQQQATIAALIQERDNWRNAARAMRSVADLAANGLHMDGSNYRRGIERIREVWVEAKQGYKLEDPTKQALAAERERADVANSEVLEWHRRYLEAEEQLQAEREKSASLHQRFAEAVQA